MKNKRFFVILLGIALVFSTPILSTNLDSLNAEECRIVRISGPKFILDPQVMTINGGTCVVWINFAKTQQVQVVFEEGNVCKDLTTAPVGFKLDASNCYVTNFIDFGGTSSLLFNEKGVFRYTLKAGQEKINGKIIVSDSIAKKAEVAVPVDTDGDGVPDSVDLCPGTPKGATVNSKGCWALKGMLLFDFDSAMIKPGAYPLLDEVAVIMEKNPEIKGEIRGHTDNVGAEEYNMQLSEKRAKAVDEYLENKGIDPSRWTIKGYGESQPIASNETLEGRQENRRVELVRIK